MTNLRLATLPATIAGLLAGFPPSAEAVVSDAQYEALLQRLRTLERKLELQEEGLARKAQKDEEEAARAAKSSVAVSTDGGHLKFKSGDGAFSMQIGGRLQADYAFYDQDKNELGDGSEIRRAYLDLRGTVYEDWDWRLQYDFARPKGGDPISRGIRDAWIRYSGFDSIRITAGNFKEPFGLDRLTSGNYITFLERPLADSAFFPNRHLGVAASAYGDRWTAALGVFGEPPEGDVNNEGNEGWDVTGRLTFAPILDEGRLLHLGAAARHHVPEDSTTSLRFRSRPESHVTGVRLADTGTLDDVEDFQSYGAELAGAYGPAHIQAEYVYTPVHRQNDAKDLEFTSWYVQAGWFLTGESRPWKAQDAVWDRLKPRRNVGKNGFGAWELAARYSQIDLNDEDIVGGREDNVTVGLNWYATPNVRFSADYVTVLDVDRKGSQFNGDRPSIFQIRGQVDF